MIGKSLVKLCLLQQYPLFFMNERSFAATLPFFITRDQRFLSCLQSRSETYVLLFQCRLVGVGGCGGSGDVNLLSSVSFMSFS